MFKVWLDFPFSNDPTCVSARATIDRLTNISRIMSSHTHDCDETSGDVYRFYLLQTALPSSPPQDLQTCGSKQILEKE